MHGGGWRDVVAEDEEHVFQQPKRGLRALTADSPPSVPSFHRCKCSYTYMHSCVHPFRRVNSSPISYARPDAKSKISWTTRRATSTRALPIPRFHALLFSSVLCFTLGRVNRCRIPPLQTHDTSIDVFIRIGLDHRVYACECFCSGRHLAD